LYPVLTRDECDQTDSRGDKPCTQQVVDSNNIVQFNSNENNNTVELKNNGTAENIDFPELPRGAWMSSRWPRAVVPFELNNKNGRLKEEAVLVAMKKIEKDTCIRFVPREKKHKKYLVVKSIGGGACWTKNIGLPSTERNVINLGPGCGTAKKILHELLHGVGMYHTHQRWDRDRYVEVVKNNIKIGRKSAFRKIPSRSRSTQSISEPFI